MINLNNISQHLRPVEKISAICYKSPGKYLKTKPTSKHYYCIFNLDFLAFCWAWQPEGKIQQDLTENQTESHYLWFNLYAVRIMEGKGKGRKGEKSGKKRTRKTKILQSVQGVKNTSVNTLITSIVIWNRVIFLKNTYSVVFRHQVTMIKQDPFIWFSFMLRSIAITPGKARQTGHTNNSLLFSALFCC